VAQERRPRGSSIALAALLALAAGCESAQRTAPPEARAAPAAAAPVSAQREARAAPLDAGRPEARVAGSVVEWSYPASVAGAMHVVVVTPEHGEGERLPVLVALHGRGEAFKGPRRGARGWLDDYGLSRALERLRRPPLTTEDFLHHVDPARLGTLNADLLVRPFAGLIVVCPYTPDILAGERPFAAAEPFARFLLDELLPRVRRETPARAEAAATGIDGVSLGGRAALLVGLGHPRAFGAVASLQAAFDAADAPALADLAQAARATNPSLRLRLLTSDRDFYVGANRAISRALDARRIEHQLDVVPGPHDYDFNRGPGVHEMLIFHDRALRAE
jgi:enterochelin esterase-like enzyme